jgi:hypothetical protein
VIVVYKDERESGACSTFTLRLRLISLNHTLIFRPSIGIRMMNRVLIGVRGCERRKNVIVSK